MSGENLKKSYKVVDLSGYSFSGKSAVYDLLNEFDGYISHSKLFEFELLRTADGVLDLENALAHNWSPVRSSEAIRRFKRLINKYGGTNSIWSRLTSIGHQYDTFFPGFTEISKGYIRTLIKASWESDWPFALNDLPISSVLYRKFIRKLGVKSSFEFEVYLSRISDKEFINITKAYFHNLFSSILGESDRAIVLNNSFEPFFPLNSHKFFSEPKSILVDRDPRDIYVSVLKQGIVQGANVGKAVSGSNVNDFINRFLIYRTGNVNDHEDILNLSFERLVLDYESSKRMIIKFLGEDESVHIFPKKYFDPTISIKGIGLWRNVSGQLQKEVNIIHSELKEFCIEI